MILWRISSHADLSGACGLLHSRRWHSRGRPVVYLAESPAGALVEALLHVLASSAAALPKHYQLLEFSIPDAAITEDAAPKLARSWRDDPGMTRSIGDAWLAAPSCLLLRVPSAVFGRSFNRLFNLRHAQAAFCRVLSSARFRFDEQLPRRG